VAGTGAAGLAVVELAGLGLGLAVMELAGLGLGWR
jgi:hypothetical protein